MNSEAPTVHAEASSAIADQHATGASITNPPLEAGVPWVPTWGMILGLSAGAATIALVAFNGIGRGLFLEILCLGMLLFAAAFDSATGRIPNHLTYTGILLGLAVNCLGMLAMRASPRFYEHWLGASGPSQSFEGLLIFGGVGLASRAMSAIGGGDMKLLAAVGAMLGRSRASDALLCGLFVGVVYSLANLVSGGRLNAAVQFVCRKTLAAIYPRATLLAADHSARVFPLAIPVFLGLLFLGLPPVIAARAWLHGS